ncbi:hypothetical protein GGS23DRAFT_388198 [Durotheca rogersii]|uniref:uncharacterized protein n=1 Tax=Durotheca rogersii TaxID=419775 RepID=UPI00221EAE66|nr:uncharacterized protein GGS23DRAFT_388198 [Durotheca rogersii]KAI5857337.1 hypothetical protein GGS23DRAFT_388198 [Durotheca rogersii]
MARFGRTSRYRMTRSVLRRHCILLVQRAGAGLSGSPRNRSSVSNDDNGGGAGWRSASSKLLEGGATALGSVFVLGLAGYTYHWYYKSLVLRKMENAFAPGYSSLELAALGRQPALADPHSRSDVGNVEDDDWIPRTEQAIIDDIVDGSTQGQYHLVTGEKGTGKTSMLLKAMKKIDGDGIAMLEAHPDLEIFRVRLGKALDYEFHEDYIGSLFSFKGPRDTTPLLDIERAFNKMEKIALKRQEKAGKPLVLIINGIHLLQDDEGGRHLLELIQQRAELWAASSLVNVVLNSDEYWITERLMMRATRLRVLPVRDIPKGPAIAALRSFRYAAFQEDVSTDILGQVYDKVGGRLRFLSQIAKSPNMIDACDSICEKEKRWFLSQCWILGKEMDSNAEGQQEFCAAAMVIAKALVEREEAMGEDEKRDGRLPQIPLHEARQIVTRADFIQHHDHLNIVTIDPHSMMVQADSVAMQNAFREVCGQDGFEEHLQATIDRLDELESLGRTRELTIKDLWGNGAYRAVVERQEGRQNTVVSLRAIPPKADKAQA